MPQTKVTHTIGPWRRERNLDATYVIGSDGIGSVVCEVRAYSEAPEETAANARLIAAAPDLLAALKAYVDWFGGAHVQGCPADDTCDCPGSAVNGLVDAAIAKAEGR